MPRQMRLEYEGAFYHVMARGDRREPIVQDDEDRRMFVRTLGEACERTGFRVHAYVLMTNHYHLLLETPEANLARGMSWFQNAFTRRINTRHRLWGHVFGGRYKSIVVEPGECYGAILDYVHLNPVRAGLIRKGEALESYGWSSLGDYLRLEKKRPLWLETALAREVTGCGDTVAGRREFLRRLEGRVDWSEPMKAGAEDDEGEGKLAVHAALRRGWMFGSQEFKERLLKMIGPKVGSNSRKRADGYHGGEMKDHGEKRAKEIISAGRAYLTAEGVALEGLKKSDWRKGLIAELIHRETTVRLDWISSELGMGERATCCRTIARVRGQLKKSKKWRLIQEKMSINND